MACPDENQLLAWCRGDAGGAASIAAHVDQCPDCQLLVGLLQTRQAKGSTLDDALPPLGTVLNGRYRLLQHVGAGAMGVVFRCFDGELEREVALKLVRGSTDADARRSGLEEARALARLNHPNVVAVYDAFAVGSWDAIAMEFVAGEDLRAWLRGTHSRAELEQVLLQATLGLEAAHAAGVVHRDFKPENVMVGQDGRVRVSDFGLSRSHARLGGTGLTTTPAGTPAYMAPELLEGRAATQASDQYALCLTAIEVLTGRRTTDSSARLLPWSRGVNADPARRWPSLRELREALAGRTRRRRAARVTGLLALAAALSFVVAQLRPPPPPDGCAPLAARAARLAAPASLAQLETALAPRLPAPSATRVVTLMRSHLEHLEALLATTCRSEREAGRAQLQTARLACLERTLFNLESLHRTAVDGGQPAALATMGYELLQCDPRQRCADDRRVRAQALTARPTADTALDTEVEALVAAFEAHEYAQVKRGLEPLLARARQLDSAWALATLLSMRAALNHDEGALDAARADLEEGISLAEADGLDLLSFTLSRERMSFSRSAEEVQAWLELTRVRARRLGNDAAVEGDLLEASGLGLWNVGDVGGAVERLHEAAEAWRPLLSGEDLMVAQVELLEGRGLVELGRFDEARPLLAHAEEVLSATLGPDAHALLDAWAAHARLELLAERPAAARPHLERARALRERLGEPTDDADLVAWRWLTSLEGAPGQAPALAEASEARRDLLVVEELERLARGARDRGQVPDTDGPMGWLATAVAARRAGDRPTAQRVLDEPIARTGRLARAHALLTVGKRAEALALVDERVVFPRRPVAK